MSVDETQASEGAAAEATVESSSSSAIDSTSSSESEAASSPEEVVSEAAPAEDTADDTPELPEFDFSAWEGGVEDLPDMYRPVGTRMHEIHSKRVGEFESELDQLRRLNDALMIGEEDPRIADFKTKFEESQSQYESLQKQHEEYQQEIEQMMDQEAEAYASKFFEKNPQLLENQEMSDAFSLLVENDWDPEIAVKLLSLKGDAVEIALKAKIEGTPDVYALRLAELHSRPSARPKPRPAAKITSGATTRSSPDQQLMGVNEQSSLDDKRMDVARRALKNARR